MSFSPEELEYLASQPLARLATVASDGQPDVVPVAFDTKKESYEGLNFHDLRKNTGTGLVAAGVDPKTAQEILGHADVRTTLEIYAQVVPELGRQAAVVMGGKSMSGTARPRRAQTQDSGSEGTDP
jgi:integrase